MEAHGEDLRAAGASAALVQALKLDPRRAALEGRAHLLRGFAIKMTRTPNRLVEADVQRLRAGGLADEEILHAVEIIAYYNYINRVADGLGVDPEPEWPKKPSWYRRVRQQRRTAGGARRRARTPRRRPGSPSLPTTRRRPRS